MVRRSICKIGLEKTCKRFKIDESIIDRNDRNNRNNIKKICHQLLHTAYQKTSNRHTFDNCIIYLCFHPSHHLHSATKTLFFMNTT